MDGFNCLKATEPLQGDSLLFTFYSIPFTTFYHSLLFSRFMSHNNNSKRSKNSEYSTNLGLDEKLWPLHKTFSWNNIFSGSHNPMRVIFNCSSYELTDDEKSVLCKGFNFSVKPGLIEYSEFLLPCELLFHNIKCEGLCNEDVFN